MGAIKSESLGDFVGIRIRMQDSRQQSGLVGRDRGKVGHEGHPERAGTGEPVSALSRPNRLKPVPASLSLWAG